MKNMAVGIIVLLCIVAAFGIAYYVVNMQYQRDIDELHAQIISLNSQMENIEVTNHKYIKQIANALKENYATGLNEGRGNAYYGEAFEKYSEGSYAVASNFSSYADAYYGFASQGHRAVKAYFNSALEYATSNNTQRLAQLFVNVSEIEAQITNHMHEANEYFASGCSYYANGSTDKGALEIARANVHVAARDALIPTENDLWYDIDALLENFY